MATLGVDCDITLAHPSVNSGQAVGFILRRSRENNTGLLTLRRQAYLQPDGSYQDRLTFWFTVIAADGQLNPDGSPYSLSRSQSYSLLNQLLAARSGLILTTAAGVWTDLHATLNVTLEYLGRTKDEITVSLNNGAATQTAPIDTARFNNSLWDGPLTWATSYWR
jgi:hypothetical protein